MEEDDDESFEEGGSEDIPDITFEFGKKYQKFSSQCCT